jgi:hypothetical protein
MQEDQMPENNDDLPLAPEEVAAAARLADEAQANLRDLAMLVMRRLGGASEASQPTAGVPQPSYWAEILPSPDGGTVWKLHEGGQCLGLYDYNRGVCRQC